MLPRKLHLEEINKFHDRLEEISRGIKNPKITDVEKRKLGLEYF